MFVLGLIWSLVRSAPSPSLHAQCPPTASYAQYWWWRYCCPPLQAQCAPQHLLVTFAQCWWWKPWWRRLGASKMFVKMFSASMCCVSHNLPSSRNLWYLQTSRIFVTSTRIFSSRWVSKTCTRNLPNRTISQELEKYETMPEDVGHCFVTWVISFSVNFTRFPFNCTP